MIARSAGDWLRAWELASEVAAPLRPIELLRAAIESASADELTDLPLGRRDALLLDLRAALLGDDVECKAACPACTTQVDLRVPLDRLRVGLAPATTAPALLEFEGFVVRFRVPTTRDQLAIAGSPSLETARCRLLAACLVEVTLHGSQVEPEALPEAVIEQLGVAMEVADPQAMTAIGLTCPACCVAWEADFDIARCLWAELDHWAKQLLCDVHELARGYGWTEPAVLALSPVRRRRYLELLAS